MDLVCRVVVCVREHVMMMEGVGGLQMSLC